MYNIWTISSETFKLNERSTTIEEDGKIYYNP